MNQAQDLGTFGFNADENGCKEVIHAKDQRGAQTQLRQWLFTEADCQELPNLRKHGSEESGLRATKGAELAPDGCVVIPTRKRASRDKTKVEAGVLVAER